MLLNNNFISKISFKKSLIIKIWVSALLTIIGIATFALMLTSISGVFQNAITAHGQSFATGFYTGIGGGLIGAGTITIIKNIILLKNKAKFQNAEIAYNDERNRFIIARTFSLTTYISLFALLLAVIVFGMIDAVIFKTLLFTLAAYALILFITYIVVKAKY